MEDPFFSDEDDVDDASNLEDLMEELFNEDNDDSNDDEDELFNEDSNDEDDEDYSLLQRPTNSNISESMRKAEVFVNELLQEDPNAENQPELDRKAELAMLDMLQEDPHANDHEKLQQRAEEAMEEMLLVQEAEAAAPGNQNDNNEEQQDILVENPKAKNQPVLGQKAKLAMLDMLQEQRQAEEAMEKMLLAQEAEAEAQGNHGDNNEEQQDILVENPNAEKDTLEEDPHAKDHKEMQRQAEEAMEEMLLAQEAEAASEAQGDQNDNTEEQGILVENPNVEKDMQQEDPHANDREEMQRQAEEAMEEMLLAQEAEAEAQGNEGNQEQQDHLLVEEDDDDDSLQENDAGFDLNDDENDNMHDDMAFLDDENLMNNHNNGGNFHESDETKNHPFTYVRVSLWAAVALVYYAFRSRQQWYLALVFLSSSKYAYVILGNAFVAMLVWAFTFVNGFFLNGLRLNEAEGLGDYFRWHITETCLALTIFRSELNVKTFLFFLCLVFSKCLHHIVDAREAHLRMTEEVVIPNPDNAWISLRMPHVKLFVLICLLQVLDVIAVVMCGQDIFKHGPSVSILFCFESAIMLTSVISNALLWHLHLMDGILHHLHEISSPGNLMHRWIYPWKDHKATLVFAVELQAQFAKFMFYLTFFSIVFTYYGLPINLIREVYVSFLALKSRLVAFNKYRQLMSSMNRFENPTPEELEKEPICIICREEMTVETAKKLPGCGHIFHSCCLREWLVQQQTCPTCRGDISEMEARQKQQAAFDARIQGHLEDARRQEGQEEGQEGENHDGEEENDTATEEVATATEEDQPEKIATEKSKEEAAKNSPPILTEEKMETEDRKPPPTIATTKPSILPTPTETESFPAFYKVVRDASVYRHEDENTAFLVTRVVPSGFVIVGTAREDRKCILQKKSMVRMPDGWVTEDDLTRIGAIPLQSLQEPQQT